jgi:hypothetical protein
MTMDPSFTTLGTTILQAIIEKNTVKGILHLHNNPPLRSPADKP